MSGRKLNLAEVFNFLLLTLGWKEF